MSLSCYFSAGPEKLKLMSSIDISMLLPHESPSKVSTMQYLWLELLWINNLLGKPLLEEGDIEEFESASKTWVDRFLSVYLKLQVTPYIHAMHSHVGQFLRQHGGLLPFTQQGLEKYNDRMTTSNALELLGVFVMFRRTFTEVITIGGASAHEF